MQRITDESVRAALERAKADPSIYRAIDEANSQGGLCKKSLGGYVRDWGLLLSWTGARTVREVHIEDFFVCMEELIGSYAASRIENFRSAAARMQKLDMSLLPEERWTQEKGFKLRFEGLLKRANITYRELQRKGEMKETKRGRITHEKLDQLAMYCKQVGETQYLIGFVVSYHLLLRHSDLQRLTGDCFVYSPVKGWQVKVVGGKDRPADYCEWVDGEDCAEVIEILAQRTDPTSAVFPEWNTYKANMLIKEAAKQFDWSQEGELYSHHCGRRGKARDLFFEEGLTLSEIMERGRWRDRLVTEGYIGKD